MAAFYKIYTILAIKNPMQIEILMMLMRIETDLQQEVTSYERLTEGYTNSVFKFECNGRKYIYKEYSTDSSVEKSVLEIIKIPKVIVNKDTYRIEEYIEHHKIDYYKDMQAIAIALKGFHSHKSPKVQSFYELVDNLKLIAIKAIKSAATDPQKEGKVSKKSINLEQQMELSRINRVLEDLETKVLHLVEQNSFETALCHNDIHSYNLLNTSNGVIVIDFEFSSVGEVLYDIANLFCETHLDYKNVSYDLSIGYTLEDKIMFLNYYFKDKKVEISEIVTKINNLKLVSHYIWVLWAIPKVYNNTNSDFDYYKYALERLKQIKNGGLLAESEINLLCKL